MKGSKLQEIKEAASLILKQPLFFGHGQRGYIY